MKNSKLVQDDPYTKKKISENELSPSCFFPPQFLFSLKDERQHTLAGDMLNRTNPLPRSPASFFLRSYSCTTDTGDFMSTSGGICDAKSRRKSACPTVGVDVQRKNSKEKPNRHSQKSDEPAERIVGHFFTSLSLTLGGHALSTTLFT